MIPAWVIVAASFGYLGLLFAIATLVDRRAEAGRPALAAPWVYSLSLAVYATAWTFYGSVGRAASDGIGFLPIYLGPTLMIALWWLTMRKILRISKANRITSLADFIASRYGKSSLLGGVVTVIAVIGILPYISLQLKAISGSLTILATHPKFAQAQSALEQQTIDTAFWVAVILALFTIAFGTRHLDASEHHPGMVAAIAFESLVKLVAFVAVGLFVTYGLFDGFGDVFARAAEDERLRRLLTPVKHLPGGYASWVWLTILSMFAIMFLPRQFQVTVIENTDERHLKTAIWLFPLYMLLINLFVLPIAFGGRLHFPAGDVDADTFVLTLPMSGGQPVLAMLVYLGGLSAATGMVIVETIALSTMVCNDLLMPLLVRLDAFRLRRQQDATGLLLWIRRGAIVTIILLGYLYFRYAGEAYALVSIGLISFAAVAQFAPVVLGGIYWKGANRAGALAGLAAGFAVWCWTLLLPAFARSGWIDIGLDDGPFGIELLRPQRLFGLDSPDPITHAMIWSMIANVGAFVAVSVGTRAGATEHQQARRFVDVFRHDGSEITAWRGSVSVAELRALATRFVGAAQAKVLLPAGLADEAGADAAQVQRVETALAGTIGASSARIMIASATREEALTVEEMRRIVDEASQVVAYSHQLEQKSRELEAATTELRAANDRLKELDRLKDDFISTVSHELRTPLTSIRAFSELLADDPTMAPEQRAEFLGIIVQESERLTRLINNILDLAKLEAGRIDWNVEALDIGEVVGQAIDATRSLFEERGVELHREHSPSAAALPAVHGDRDRLVQVVINLLSNAVKFSPPASGRVVIAIGCDDTGVCVSVADNGPGVAAADRQMIFEKFRQGGDTLTDRPAGTGLGLPISRQIIEGLGGRLWLDETASAGARFVFSIPVAGGPGESRGGSPASEEG